MKREPQDGVWCYEQQVPPFVEAELDRLYGARYASLAHLALHGRLAQASTFVIERGGVIAALLVFARRNGVLTVLNEGMALAAEHIALFAEHMFRIDASVRVIRFEAIEASRPQLRFPCQWLACAADSAMPLPATAEAWLASLSANTRGRLKRNAARLARAEPSFRFTIGEQRAVNPADVRAIIALNRLRVAGKHMTPAIERDEEERIVAYVRQRGFVGIARICGKLCGGVILYRLGRNFSLRILAHAPDWDHLNLGSACLYLTICRAIAHGNGGRFFFGWGDDQYKQRFGARRRQLNRLLIYRSRLALARHAALALRALRDGAAFRARAALAALGRGRAGR